MHREEGRGPESELCDRSRVLMEEQSSREEGIWPDRDEEDRLRETTRFSRWFQQETPVKPQMNPTGEEGEKVQDESLESGSEMEDLNWRRQVTSSSATAAVIIVRVRVRESIRVRRRVEEVGMVIDD